MIDSMKNRTTITFYTLTFLSCIHVINVLLNEQLLKFGIVPRRVDQFHHIFFAPFIHGSYSHLLQNIAGLAVFIPITYYHSTKQFLLCSAFILLFSGILVWSFGRPAIHVGASGWIYGLWGLAISSAWFNRRFSSMVIAISVVFFYSGLFYGLMPLQSGVSFETHVFGALSGIIFSMLISKRIG